MSKLLKIFAILVILPILAQFFVISASAAGGSIQNMVDNAQPGAVITIPAGTYTENVAVNKPITINAANVVLHANGGDGITITGSGVTISGITVRNARNGVYLAAASGNTISGCDLSDNAYGVYGDSASNNKIIGVKAYNEVGNGVALGDGAFFNQGGSNTVTNCDMSHNVVFGISFYSSPNNVIAHNTFSWNTRVGVRLGPGSNNNQVYGNTIENNGAFDGQIGGQFPACGVLIVNAEGNRVYDNTFSGQATNIIGPYIDNGTPPTPQPTATPVPTAKPTANPTVAPTVKPTPQPTPKTTKTATIVPKQPEITVETPIPAVEQQNVDTIPFLLLFLVGVAIAIFFIYFWWEEYGKHRSYRKP